MHTRHPILRRLGALGAAVCCAGALMVGAGCNIVAPIAYLVGGPPKTPALYELDRRRPTVVFIDDRASVVPRRALRASIGQEAESTMIEQGVVDQESMISASATLRLAMAERYGEPRSIDSVGEEVGAEVVVYVEMVSWSLRGDGVTFAPTARVSVKVLDVANDVRLWPQTIGGHVMTVQLPQTASQGPTNRVERNTIEEGLARLVGLRIARLFYTHEADPLSGRLDD
jgi:hypothetical protein